jgi:6-phosphofructokinase
MRIGILTAGGDCPGLNAAIRGVGKTAIVKYGMEVTGISSGFEGLVTGDTVALNESDLSGILTLGAPYSAPRVRNRSR